MVSLPENTVNLSPMMRQYVEVKKQHMDKLLFYRLGDFYELFFHDAEIASKELDLVLTGRDCGLSEKAPMCGVPFHAVDSYISKLVEKGYKVVVCEQLEDPSKTKTIVKRGIVRIVTPGTLTDTEFLDESANNYLCSIYCSENNGIGISFVDISTGSLYVSQFECDYTVLLNELSRFEPKEIILNNSVFDNSLLQKYCESEEISSQIFDDEYFKFHEAVEKMNALFQEKDVAPLYSEQYEASLYSCTGLIHYLLETQFSGIDRLCSFYLYTVQEYINLSPSCVRNLELFRSSKTAEKKGSLLWAIDRTNTSMGSRLIRSFLEKPLMNPVLINARLDAVDEFYNNSILCGQISDLLSGIIDIERLLTRLVYGKCNPRDLISVAQSFGKIEQIKALSSAFKAPLLKSIGADLNPFTDLKEIIEQTISSDPPISMKEGGYIRSGFNQEIDDLRSLLFDTKKYLSKLESETKENTGLRNLKIGYNRVFGYYFEVSKGSLDQVPDYFIRKQTLTTGERYITEELKELETKILSSGERLNLLEKEFFDQVCATIINSITQIQKTASALAYLDVLCSLGELARDYNYCRPTVNNSDTIAIRDGRHPVVELVSKSELFVPNDAVLNNGDCLLSIITGPNMSGKSTYMRQTALIVILAQIGSFVPASSATIGVVDAIFTRVGASDDLFAGDSTFMVEMREVAEILQKATKQSLVVLDEIGRGTSTYDGMSIARAVIEFICADEGIHCKTMFATHYHELTDMDLSFSNVKNYNIAVKKRGDTVIFLRKIVPGPADDSYGIEVAQLAGVPKEVTNRAKEILNSLESENQTIVRRQVVTTYSETDNRIRAKLKNLNIQTITPLEAMSILNELIQDLQDEEENK